MNSLKTNLFKNIEIEINNYCNRKCRYCPNSINEMIEKADMEWDIYEKIIEQLLEMEFSGRISFHFYNEPLLNKNIKKHIQYTKLKLPECKQVLYSNGDFLTETLLYELFNLGIDQFVITNHSDTKENHNFYKVYTNLVGERKKNIVYLNSNELNLTSRCGNIDIGKNINCLHTPCFIPKSLIIIDVKGNIITCFEDYKRISIMGNILDVSIFDIWNSKKYSYLRGQLCMGNRNRFAHCTKCINTSMIYEPQQYDYFL